MLKEIKEKSFIKKKIIKKDKWRYWCYWCYW